MSGQAVAIGRVFFKYTALRTVLVWMGALLTLSTTAPALTLDVPRLPAPVFADREAAGDTAIPVNAHENLRRFRLELAFDATPSNNVQVAFGRDAEPLDGKLAAEETALIIGWDGAGRKANRRWRR